MSFDPCEQPDCPSELRPWANRPIKFNGKTIYVCGDCEAREKRKETVMSDHIKCPKCDEISQLEKAFMRPGVSAYFKCGSSGGNKGAGAFQQSDICKRLAVGKVLLRELKTAHQSQCSLLCPSVKKTDQEWTHHEACEDATAAIAEAEAMSECPRCKELSEEGKTDLCAKHAAARLDSRQEAAKNRGDRDTTPGKQ